jgi:predicted Zn-dependent protease
VNGRDLTLGIVAGLAVWAIGSLGMVFGRLIQAAISRQREFLADAAAVQYTRNPDGIAGALAKIRDHYSARIESPAASELNHFFFCTSLNTLFATHPPIDERIRRIVAMGAAKVGAREDRRAGGAARADSAASGAAGGAAVAGFAGAAGSAAITSRPPAKGTVAF